MFSSNEYNLVILDINLPKINGYDICKNIRLNNNRTPILMLTAFGSTSDKVQGFNMGADDYLVKPFEFEELFVRVRALLKRAEYNSIKSENIVIADLEINRTSKTVKRSGQKIELTAKEFLLLEYLAINKNRILSKVDIAEKIWDQSFDSGTNIIELYIYYLRKKIDKDHPIKLIHTQIGMGYTIKEGDE